MAGTTQKGGKNRKYGRNLKSKSAIAYNAEHRDVKNKAARLAKHLKQVAANATKIMKVLRGTARHARRVKEGITK